jgi:hypothetical protein
MKRFSLFASLVAVLTLPTLAQAETFDFEKSGAIGAVPQYFSQATTARAHLPTGSCRR